MTWAAVILAAGAGERLGGVAKALLTTNDDQTFLAAVAHTARQAGVTRIVVVTAKPFCQVVNAEALRLDLDVVENKNPDRGMASSVACGFAYAHQHFSDARGALLWPVDHAQVTPATVKTVLAAEGDIVVPSVGDRGGHPTRFARDLWPELLACEHTKDGARSVVRADPTRVTRVPVDDQGVIADVDVPP